MRLFRAIVLVSLAFGLGACDSPADKSRPGQHKRTPPVHRVVVQAVEKRPVAIQRELNATIRARRIARLYNEEPGRITRLNGYEGDAVAAGKLLASLDDTLLRAELKKARATTRQARLDVERLRKLVKRKVASADELARARTALDIATAEQEILSTRLRRTRITAPFAGIISERLREPGDVVAANTHLLSLFDPTSQFAETRISELLLPFVHEGDPASLRIDALPGETFSGRVRRIHPTLDPLTRLGAIEISLDSIPDDLKPGQFARARLAMASAERLMVPFTAVQRDSKGPFVYVLVNAKAVHRGVRTGIRLDRDIAILEGLRPGDQVIVKGFLGLSAGKTVKPVNTARADESG